MPEQSAENSPWKQREFILNAFLLLSRSHVRLGGFCSAEGVAQPGAPPPETPGGTGNLAGYHRTTKLLALFWRSLCVGIFFFVV